MWLSACMRFQPLMQIAAHASSAVLSSPRTLRAASYSAVFSCAATGSVAFSAMARAARSTSS
ncbi:hypothetical protein WU86_06765 [Corynebacterium xerosis]|nr:hypothetical protein WU86_06765 [Corynebacterium xerosis]